MDFATALRTLPELETTRLLLRRMTVSDAEAMFDYARHPHVSRYCTWSMHGSIDDTRGFLEYWTSGYGTDAARDWAVVEKASGRMIGTGGFARFDASSLVAELGYVLHPDVWGRGYATELVRAAIAWGFASDDLERIEARCLSGNIASARVMEKAGMRREGTMRRAYRKLGIQEDVHIHSILRDDVRGTATTP